MSSLPYVEDERFKFDPILVRYLKLRELMDQYREVGFANLDVVEESLKDVHREKMPANYKVEPIPENALFEGLKMCSIMLVRHIGFADCDSGTLNILAGVIDEKLKIVCKQFMISKQRRTEKIQTAFSSPIQHVLCLNGIQNVLDLKVFYDKRFLQRYQSIKDKWTQILNAKKSIAPHEDEDSDKSSSSLPIKRSRFEV